MDRKLFSTTPFSFQFRLEEVCAKGRWQDIFPSIQGLVILESDEELAKKTKIPGPVLSRFLSRSGLLLMNLYPELQRALDQLSPDLTRVGIYGSIGKGVTNLESVESIFSQGEDHLMETLFKRTPPMQVVKEALYIPGAQLSILLKTTGPVNTFPHWKYGVLHAAQAAQIDFTNKVIDAAIVFGASALDNPFGNLAIQSKLSQAQIQKEGAAAVFLRSEESAKVLVQQLIHRQKNPLSEFFHGHADLLFQIEQQERS